MNISNYSTLTTISSLPEWLAFRRIALENPQEILARQSDFLHRARMLTDPAEVRRRFSRLFSGNGAIAPLQVVAAPAVQDEAVEPMRVLFVAKSQVATLQLSFLKPLDQLRQDGELEWDVLTENELAKRFGAKAHSNEMRGLLERHIASFGPDLMVFCRYSGPHAATILEQARNLKIPSIYHIDDDLLSIPVELGEQKWAMHNAPFRLEAVRHLLDNVDLIYSSTSRLTARLREYGFKTPIYTGSVYCSGSILKPAQLRPVSRVGYMGTDHSHDFAKVASAVERYLDDNPKVSFEFFGSTPKPEEFSRFGDRVRVVPPIQDYSAFLAHFATMNWDIGICALADLPFNALKANTKWVEYTTVGTAVVGTRGSVYDSCMSDGCGILAQTEEEWLAGLTRLTADPALRYALVQRAQQRVETDYSLTRLRLQVLDVFREAKTLSQGDGAVEAVLQGNLTEPLRVIFISNGHIPTLQLSFIKPLLQLKVCGKVDWDLVTEMDMAERFGSSLRSAATRDALKRHIDNYAPNVIVFCRYSGPHSEALVTHSQEKKIPVIYHIDDDLLNIPIEIGEKKWLSHNQPARLASVRHLLSSADLIYASTNALRDRLQSHGFATPMFSAPIYCSGSVLNRAVERPVTRIGYMGFDHAHDFALVIPPLLRYLDRNPHVIFELFGSIPKPPIFDRFGERFRVVPPVRDYSDFLKHFAALNWDIGICPLANTPFNAVKANTKWVEYTSVGAAVVATRGTIYDSCTAGDCGILAGSEDEWLDAFERLTADPALRRSMVERAQQRLEREYSVPALTRQVLDVFECAKRKVLKKLVSPEFIFTS